MAKRKPTTQEMESALGYEVDHSLYDGSIGHRFYSDLVPISERAYDRTEKEYLNIPREERYRCHRVDADSVLSTCNKTMTISGEGHIIDIKRSDSVGPYKFFIDIHYAFGLDMPLLFTEAEAFDVISASQLGQSVPVHADCTESTDRQPRPGSARQSHLTLLNLPRELRDKIYSFTLQGAQRKAQRRRIGVTEDRFCSSIGDLSGFYFPFGDDSTLLRVNRQMRQEALPLAYRHTTFYLIDIEDLTRFLIGVGRVGRDNIESLNFSWESQIDLDDNWCRFPDSETNDLILPAWHVSPCVQLLKQCRRLKSLHLKFEKYLMTDVPLATFKPDPGILSLGSIGGAEEVAILDPDGGPLSNHVSAQWLKDHLSKKPSTEN